MMTFFTTLYGKALILTYIVITCLTLPPTLYSIVKYRKEKLKSGELIGQWISGVLLTLFVEGILFTIYLICLAIVAKKITLNI